MVREKEEESFRSRSPVVKVISGTRYEREISDEEKAVEKESEDFHAKVQEGSPIPGKRWE